MSAWRERDIMVPLLLTTRALEFAALKHTDQRRKGERGEPYVNHLAEVAVLLAEATHGDDPILIAGGLLHDTLEDTETTYEELEASFGPEIAHLVKEVTDDTSLPRADRKRLQIEKTPGKSARARQIKIADKISNLRALLRTPPTGWCDIRKRDYVDWAAAVVAGCRGLNPALDRLFDQAHADGLAAFGEPVTKA
ncbi:MAG TPA: HD domain-containing protein [Aliidongia sp.]|nr:HD domain-containing protein [Aliidongia sp.]